MSETPSLLVLHPGDSVAVLTGRSETGGRALGAGHKIARTPLAAGAPILKFGQIIGYATEDIAEGAHVHTHNCAFGDHDQAYEIGTDLDAARAAIPVMEPATFMGYRRPGGQAGTRNYIAICATVNCSATVVRRAADEVNASGLLDAYPNVDGAVAFSHGTGCAMATNSPGYANLQRVLWGHATHPNVGRGDLRRARLRGDAGRTHEGDVRRRRLGALPRPHHPGYRRHHEDRRRRSSPRSPNCCRR